jgi:hypothetical protein
MSLSQLRTRHIKLLVLDEADEMLSMNFTEQIYNCYRYLPPDCQVNKQHSSSSSYSYAYRVLQLYICSCCVTSTACSTQVT